MSVTGAAGPFDVQTIVSNLMMVERQPLNAMNQREQSYSAQLSAYGTIKSDVSSLQSAANALRQPTAFSVFNATPADTTLLSATADSTAVAGSYTVTVNNLASAQTMVSANQASETTGLGNAATTLNIQVGTGTAVAVNIAANSTLDQVRDAINAANAGVSATIVNNGAGFNLVYTATKTGASNTISATTADAALGAVAGSASMTQTTAAANASLTVNGVAVTSASNTVTGAIQGVSLNLQKPTGTTTVAVAQNYSAIETTINNFISAYNKFNNDVTPMYSKGGQLEADATVLGIQDQFSNVFDTPTGFSATGGYDYLAQIGITRGLDGTLSLNTTTFENAMNTNKSGVLQLFTDANKGIATQIYNQANQMTSSNGMLTSRTDGLNSSIQDVQNQITDFNTRMDSLQQSYITEYTNLNTMVASMQQTMTYLSKMG